MSRVVFRSGDDAPRTPASRATSARTSDVPRGTFTTDEFGTVYAFGDIHGDYEALEACLLMTGCVSASDVTRWTGGPRVAVVVLGDVVDRWRENSTRYKDLLAYSTVRGVPSSIGEREDDEERILDTLNALTESARAHGSAVFRLFGNHEFMQSMCYGTCVSQAQYASPFALGIADDDGPTERDAKYTARFLKFRSEAMRNRLLGGGALAIVKIGSRVFVHGGIDARTIPMAGERDFIAYCNRLARGWLAGDLAPDEEADFRRLLFEDGGSPPFDPPGILWDRALSNDGRATASDPGACSVHTAAIFRGLNANARAFGAGDAAPTSSIVVSHCTQRESVVKGMRPANRIDDEREPFIEWTTEHASPRFLNNWGAELQGINCMCDGAVWRIDVAMSRAFAIRPDSPTCAATRDASRPSIIKFRDDTGECAVRVWRTPLAGVECMTMTGFR